MKKYLFLMLILLLYFKVLSQTYNVQNAGYHNYGAVNLDGSITVSDNESCFPLGDGPYGNICCPNTSFWYGKALRKLSDKWVISSSVTAYYCNGFGCGSVPTCGSPTDAYINYDVSSNTPPQNGWVKPDGSSTDVIVTPATPPCPSNLNYQNLTDNFTSTPNPSLKKASISITATNQITVNGTNVTYQAGNKVELNAGFKADNGTVFLAQIAGCN